MENSGKDFISGEYTGWKYWNLGWYVSVSSQDKTLVFCGWYAGDSDYTGSGNNADFSGINLEKLPIVNCGLWGL